MAADLPSCVKRLIRLKNQNESILNIIYFICFTIDLIHFSLFDNKVGSLTIEFPNGDVKTLVRLGMTFWYESGGTGGEWTIQFPAVVRVKDVNGRHFSAHWGGDLV